MKASRFARNLVFYLIIAVILVLFLFPIFWLGNLSLKASYLDFFSEQPLFVMYKISFDYYLDLFSPFEHQLMTIVTWGEKLTPRLMNSLIVALSSTVISLALGTPAAYGFANLKFRGKKDMLFYFLTTRMIPPISMAVPFFVMWTFLGLIDTYPGIIATHVIINLSFVIWVMTGFFGELPKEMIEASIVDGASQIQSFLRVALPLSLPGLASTAVFCMIFSWNDFLYALVLTGTTTQTMPVAVTGFRTANEIRWGSFTAAGFFTIIPIFIFTLLIQKYIVRGMTLGAVRG